MTDVAGRKTRVGLWKRSARDASRYAKQLRCRMAPPKLIFRVETNDLAGFLAHALTETELEGQLAIEGVDPFVPAGTTVAAALDQLGALPGFAIERADEALSVWAEQPDADVDPMGADIDFVTSLLELAADRGARGYLHLMHVLIAHDEVEHAHLRAQDGICEEQIEAPAMVEEVWARFEARGVWPVAEDLHHWLDDPDPIDEVVEVD